MWIREPDDTVYDEAGAVVYFSLERFVRDICLGDCCFICGAAPASVPFNDEHVIPRWLLRRYDLFASSVPLPNDTNVGVPTFHSITSSARASSAGGISRPSALAVLRLILSSIRVGCSTGRSVGLAPFRILPTKSPALRNISKVLAAGLPAAN